jgi:hypothetical protein
MPSKRKPAAPVAKGNFWQSVTAKSQIYYKRHGMTAGDQPPVGILLCTRKNQALVEFALGDLSNNLFVSRYAVEMPKKTEMERFLKQAGKEVGYED